MRPGSLSRQYKDRENQTGVYYQLSYTRNMKSRTKYVARDAVPAAGSPTQALQGLDHGIGAVQRYSAATPTHFDHDHSFVTQVMGNSPTSAIIAPGFAARQHLI